MAQELNRKIINPDGTTSYVSGATPQDVNTAITTASLAPTPPINVGTPPTPTIPNTGGANAIMTANQKYFEQQQKQHASQSDPNSLEAMMAKLTGSGTTDTNAKLYQDTYGLTPEQVRTKQTTAETGYNTALSEYQTAQDTYNALNAQIQGLDYQKDVVNPNQTITDYAGRASVAGQAGINEQKQRQILLQKAPLQYQALLAQADMAAKLGKGKLAEGILNQANAHIDNLYEARKTDLANTVNRQNDLIDKAWSYFTEKEKTKAADIKAQTAANGTQANNFINDVQAAIKEAASNGNAALAGNIAKLISAPLDPTSKTFATDYAKANADLANLAGQIKPKDLAGGGTNANNAINSGQPVVAPADPTKTTTQNNMQTLQQVFQSSKVSAGNKTSIGNGLALAQAAQDLADANMDGTFSGFSPFRAVTDIKIPFTNIGLPFREALKRNKTIQNESLISALDLQTQFWASGAALSDSQTALVKNMIPTVTNTDTQIRTKVNQLINYMLSQTASRLVTDGIDFKPAKVDMFETVGLLDKASPEQLAELKAAGLTQ